MMTMTDEEGGGQGHRPARRQIIDRCDSMSPVALLSLHGVLAIRTPSGRTRD